MSELMMRATSTKWARVVPGNDFEDNDPFEDDDWDEDDDDKYCPSCDGIEGMQYCTECHRIDSYA